MPKTIQQSDDKVNVVLTRCLSTYYQLHLSKETSIPVKDEVYEQLHIQALLSFYRHVFEESHVSE